MASYQIQNAGGEVFGRFEMPANDMSAELWVEELRESFGETSLGPGTFLGINGVQAYSRPNPEGGVSEDEIVVDLNIFESASELVPQVHAAIGRIAAEHSDN